MKAKTQQIDLLTGLTDEQVLKQAAAFKRGKELAKLNKRCPKCGNVNSDGRPCNFAGGCGE